MSLARLVDVEIENAQRLHFMLGAMMIIDKQFLTAYLEQPDHHAGATVSTTAWNTSLQSYII